MGNIFKFKQFQVDQEGCAMKINTDGVLLAAMVQSHSSPRAILDIGTGTGVIALMLAQKFRDAEVTAVEIDASAAQTAKQNFKNSVFKERIQLSNIAIEQYSNLKPFDIVVSNPPFFVNDLKNPEKRKELARHADENFFYVMMEKVAIFLSAIGTLWLILPPKQADLVIELGSKKQLNPSKIIHVFSDATKPEFRQILCLDYSQRKAQHEDFYIYESNQIYTEAYKLLLKDFFLAF